LKLVTVIGTRPQLIKAAAVQPALADSRIENVLVDTGQHYDSEMAAHLVEELGLDPPRINCRVGSGRHGAQTGRMLEAVEAALLDLQPDRVLVYGDTNSTLAGALSAVKLGIPVAHVEAGLRSHDMSMPEEVNRVLTDRIADVLFAPTQSAARQLLHEGCALETVHTVGDVMLDAALSFAPDPEAAAETVSHLLARRPEKPLLLATVHRADNTRGEQLGHIVDALSDLASEYEVVLPLHPRSRKALEEEGLLKRVQRKLNVIPPCTYTQILSLIQVAKAVITDSGGLQKEGYFLRTPVITLRATTEWSELVDLGWNTLVAPSPCMAMGLRTALDKAPPESHTECPFGDGRAARRIAETLSSLDVHGGSA